MLPAAEEQVESQAGGDGGLVAGLSPQLRSRLRCCREAASARQTEPMLDLEVVPERSLGNEQWEFTLGECGVLPQDISFFPPCPSYLWSLSLIPLRPRFLASSVLSALWPPGTKLLAPTGQTHPSVAQSGLDALTPGLSRAPPGAVVQ